MNREDFATAESERIAKDFTYDVYGILRNDDGVLERLDFDGFKKILKKCILIGTEFHA